MKKIIILILIVFVSLAGFFYFRASEQTKEQVVLQQSIAIAKEYLSLRLQTDNVLIDAESFPDYESWKTEMTKIIEGWKYLEKESQGLEESSDKIAKKLAVDLSLVQTAHAYTTKEINDIYDKAPKFQGIATLAKHLGVDAKRAQTILDQTQAESSSEAFAGEGNTMENFENTAIVVKDGCKVAGFVGGIVLTGGTAGLATAGTLTQATVVITGADLALEVTEDGAKIALGDKNKISSFVGDVRTVTEPIANVITITNIPNNLGNAFGKFDAVMVGLEQFRDTVQEGKVVGVDLTTFEYHKPFQLIRKTKYPGTITVAEMEKAEVEAWLKSLNKEYKPMSKKELNEYLGYSSKVPVQGQKNTKDEAVKYSENIIDKTKLMPVKEFEELFDKKIAFENISKAKKIFGEPDAVNTFEDGYGNYVYYRRLVYPGGNIARFTIRFHNSDVEGYSIGLEE